MTQNKTARQIQIRRGTADEHATFTGAVGEITMDTTNNTLRVHDGQTVGGIKLAKHSEIPDIATADYVTEWQTPNAGNNHTWYRKYKSGWVEQGGLLGGTSFATVVLPVEMADTNYIINCQWCGGQQSNFWPSDQFIRNITTTGFETNGPNTQQVRQRNWMVVGMRAV